MSGNKPYARKGYVSKTQCSHINLVKFYENLFGSASTHPRLDTADDMTDCFDPAQVPLAPPKLPRLLGDAKSLTEVTNA